MTSGSTAGKPAEKAWSANYGAKAARKENKAAQKVKVKRPMNKFFLFAESMRLQLNSKWTRKTAKTPAFQSFLDTLLDELHQVTRAAQS